ncbi:interferon alpha/beta receptor 1 [Anolis carolinensis]|uniref:interferon alpha/beta receptor 1 n=1 Tax=Anolis carolinensis TaxID=28377 RepID=UPI002F2B6357
MAGARAVLVVLAALGVGAASPGLICLKEPHNVNVDVVDTTIILKWEWDNPCDLNVTFSTRYQQNQENEEISPDTWSAILECQDITTTECDLSSTILEYLENYTVGVRADTTQDYSPWADLTFCPFMNAKIGPPGVWLDSINGNEKIIILNPEINKPVKMWESENLCYNLTIWKNSSHPEEKTGPVFPGQFIHDLEPETTYCLKVNAFLPYNNGLYSPEYCKRTPKAWTGLPVPEHLQVHALNMKCVLYWDYLYEGNVSFLVQSLFGHKSRSSPDISKNWINVSGCENVQTAHCDISDFVGFDGIYYFQIQAVQNHKKSPWSKMQRFEPHRDNNLGPPSIKLNASEDSLQISVASPGEVENNSMSKLYPLTYQIWYWPNSSYNKKKEFVDKTSPPYVISGLSPSTLYCVQVQAFAQQYNKSSEFSNVSCIEIAKGNFLAVYIPIAIFVAVILLIIGFIYFTHFICKQVKYVFFPKCNPPLTIENIGGKDVSSSYLLTSEEPTEDCVVIVDNSSPNDVDLVDVKDLREQEEISQDSGNYSNNSGSKGSLQTTEQKET